MPIAGVLLSPSRLVDMKTMLLNILKNIRMDSYSTKKTGNINFHVQVNNKLSAKTT